MRVEKVANFINNSKATQKLLRGVNDNPAIFSAGVAFVAASILRPAAVFVLPIKDEKDKAYTIGASVSAGAVELAMATAVFIPLNKVINKASKELYKAKGTIYENNNLLLRQFKSINNRFFKIGLLPATAWARFAFIGPFVKCLFKGDKNVVGDETRKEFKA